MRKNMGGFTDSAELLVEYSRLYRYYVLGVVSDPCEFWQNLKFTACGSTSVEDSSGM
jgi:hypothetical protein